MAVYISLMTVDDVGNPEPISPDIDCARLTVCEQGQAGTTDYKLFNIADTAGAGSYMRVPAGMPQPFPAGVSSNARLKAGVNVALIATVTGTVTFTKLHEL